jgi:hypothetical protein
MSEPIKIFRATLSTPYHIDFSWWEREGNDLRVDLKSHLCAEHQAQFAEMGETTEIDWVDPDTAEVRRMDGLQYTLTTHCARQPDYYLQQTSLVDAVFRVFLANGNIPQTCAELAEKIGRPNQANTILKTIGGVKVYKGIRPVVD